MVRLRSSARRHVALLVPPLRVDVVTVRINGLGDAGVPKLLVWPVAETSLHQQRLRDTLVEVRIADHVAVAGREEGPLLSGPLVYLAL
jgi:hypothetical protein